MAYEILLHVFLLLWCVSSETTLSLADNADGSKVKRAFVDTLSSKGSSLFMPLNMVGAMQNKETYGKLLRSRFSSGDFNVDDVDDATQMVFNLTDHLTAICHVQFHTAFTNDSMEDMDRGVAHVSDHPIPNGFIHIDPPDQRENRTILDIIRSTRQLSKLYRAVQQVPYLPEYLQCNASLTVFAPNDEAIDKFGTEKFLILMQWPTAMQELLTNLVVTNGSFLTSDWTNNAGLQTLNSYGNLAIRITDDRIIRVLNARPSPFTPSNSAARSPALLPDRAREDQALLLESDYTATNGVLHVIDSILYPPVPSVNDTVAQLFPLHPYTPLLPIEVDGDCIVPADIPGSSTPKSARKRGRTRKMFRF